jgi:hypothetical protein
MNRSTGDRAFCHQIGGARIREVAGWGGVGSGCASDLAMFMTRSTILVDGGDIAL